MVMYISILFFKFLSLISSDCRVRLLTHHKYILKKKLFLYPIFKGALANAPYTNDLFSFLLLKFALTSYYVVRGYAYFKVNKKRSERSEKQRVKMDKTQVKKYKKFAKYKFYDKIMFEESVNSL